MGEIITFVGLDVHKETITVALAENGRRGDVREYGRVANTPEAVKGLLSKVKRPGREVRFCYEAGPCGYGIQRQLTAAGEECVVIAPSLMPRKPGERIKTDRRDAISLAKLHRAGELTPVWVPDPAHEAMRDLTRARLAAVRALRQARQQLSGFLLRHGRHYGRPAWTVMRNHYVRVFVAACTLAAGTAATYLGIYLPTYAQKQLGMAPSASYALPMLGTLISFVVTPVSAHWSDKVGRLVPCLLGAALMLLLAYPSFAVIATIKSFVVVALAAAVIALLRSFYSAPLAALFGELFPPALRGVGMSVSYSLGVLLFGSLTPFVNTWAIGATGWKSFPGIWLAACSAITLASLWIIRTYYKLEKE